jgi:hypothetical protein
MCATCAGDHTTVHEELTVCAGLTSPTSVPHTHAETHAHAHTHTRTHTHAHAHAHTLLAGDLTTVQEESMICADDVGSEDSRVMPSSGSNAMREAGVHIGMTMVCFVCVLCACVCARVFRCSK